MTNQIVPSIDQIVVKLDPGYVLTQPAPLPDEKGQPKLTGRSVATVLASLAQQIVGAKTPDLYPRTLRPMTGVVVEWKGGQFVITFKKVEAADGLDE